MTPAADAGDGVEFDAMRGGVARRARGCREEHDRSAVTDLAAILFPDAAVDDRVVALIRGEARVLENPLASLGIRVALRVGEVDLGDLREVLVSQSITPLVLLGEQAEHVRPGILHALTLVAGPHGGAADVGGRLVAGNVAHLLDADDRGEVVAAGLEVRRGGERREATGGTGALVAARRQSREGRIGGGEEAAEMPLAAEEFRGEIADVRDRHVRGFEPRGLETREDGVAEGIEDLDPVTRPVGRKIGLVTTEDIGVAGHGAPP